MKKQYHFNTQKKVELMVILMDFNFKILINRHLKIYKRKKKNNNKKIRMITLINQNLKKFKKHQIKKQIIKIRQQIKKKIQIKNHFMI